MAAPTVKRLSPGIYEINGKRINAATSDAALAAYNKANPTKAAADKAAYNKANPTKAAADKAAADKAAADKAAADKAAADTTSGGIDTSKVTNTSDVDAINRAKEIIGVGEQYGRGIASEFYADGSLGRQAATLTPEEKQALTQAQQFSQTAGVQTDAVKALLGQQQGILTNAQQLSPLELEALGVARSSLSGLDAPEMEALRSQARQNIVGQQQAGIRDLAKSQARNQVFGSAATAQRNLFNQAGVRETRNLERDLLVSNIGIKQAAQNAFTGLVTNTEANKAGRTNAASGQLANTTLSDESNRGQLQLGANNSLGSIATNTGNSLRGIEQFNLGQAAAEKAGQVGSIFGGIGTITGQRGLIAGENFSQDQFDLSKVTGEQLMKILQDSLKKQGL